MKKILLFSDGGARGNPGPAAVGILLCDSDGNKLRDHREVIGETTNNVAEYTGVIRGLEMARELGASEVDAYLDSQLVAHQLAGVYRIKTPHIRDLVVEVRDREKSFTKVSFTHVPRTHEKIRYVDKLVNRALNEAGY